MQGGEKRDSHVKAFVWLAVQDRSSRVCSWGPLGQVQ